MRRKEGRVWYHSMGIASFYNDSGMLIFLWQCETYSGSNLAFSSLVFGCGTEKSEQIEQRLGPTFCPVKLEEEGRI